jgi:hypothetical protein
MPTWSCGSANCPTHSSKLDECSSGVWNCTRRTPMCLGHRSKKDVCVAGERWTCGAKSCQWHASKSALCIGGTWLCGRYNPPCPGHSSPNHSCRDELLELGGGDPEQADKYIKSALSTVSGDTLTEKLESAWAEVANKREQNCRDKTLAIAEHYLFARWRVAQFGRPMFTTMRLWVLGYATLKVAMATGSGGAVHGFKLGKCPATPTGYWQIEYGFWGTEDGLDDHNDGSLDALTYPRPR